MSPPGTLQLFTPQAYAYPTPTTPWHSIAHSGETLIYGDYPHCAPSPFCLFHLLFLLAESLYCRLAFRISKFSNPHLWDCSGAFKLSQSLRQRHGMLPEPIFVRHPSFCRLPIYWSTPNSCQLKNPLHAVRASTTLFLQAPLNLVILANQREDLGW